MIPQIIHYCWFGYNEKSDTIQRCIDTWRVKLSNYQIVEWNESNFNIVTAIPYVREAYEKRKWAFVSDYVRLIALYNYGGIYFDTDVEVFKTFDGLLRHDFFCGFESKDYISTAVIGAVPGHKIIKDFIDLYEHKHFVNRDGTLNTNDTNVVELTKLLKRHGLKLNGKEQILGDDIVFPQYYFSSNNFMNIFGVYSKKIYAYHHYAASWYKKNTGSRIYLFKHYLVGKARNMIGTNFLRKVRGKSE